MLSFRLMTLNNLAVRRDSICVIRYKRTMQQTIHVLGHTGTGVPSINRQLSKWVSSYSTPLLICFYSRPLFNASRDSGAGLCLKILTKQRALIFMERTQVSKTYNPTIYITKCFGYNVLSSITFLSTTKYKF